MDILYIVGKGSKWFNNELRYSLRSIEKNGVNIGRVFVVGEDPKFLNPENVEYVYCYDKYGESSKHNNIHYKIEYMIRTGLLGDHFLIMSDDQFYIKQTDFDKLPVYYKNKQIPTEVPVGFSLNTYWESLFETRKFLLKNGLPVYQTNPHCAKHIDVNLWKDNQHLIDKGFNVRHGAEINLLMGNLMIANGIEPQPIKDCKVFEYKSEKELLEKIDNRSVFSIDDGAIEGGIGKYFGELFPEKSKYEL